MPEQKPDPTTIRFPNGKALLLVNVACALENKDRNLFIGEAAEEKAREVIIARGLDPARITDAA